MNYIDVVFIIFVATFTFIGYRKGLIREGMDILVLGLSFLAAFFLSPIFARILISVSIIPESFTRAGSFFAIWFVFEFVFFLVERFIIRRLDENLSESSWNVWGGLVLGAVKAVLVGSFIIALMLIPPISTFVSPVVKKSFLGTRIINNANHLESLFKKMLGGVAVGLSDFSTITSGSDERIDLGFTVATPSVDRASVGEMLRLVNAERKKNDLAELKLDSKLSKVAEAHGRDMLTKGYLSHKNLDGKSPFDRVRDAGISFFYAGENLAIAQSTDVAMEGLMQSPGHKANILSGDYGKIGISVLDGGTRGKIFVQEFTE